MKVFLVFLASVVAFLASLIAILNYVGLQYETMRALVGLVAAQLHQGTANDDQHEWSWTHEYGHRTLIVPHVTHGLPIDDANDPAWLKLPDYELPFSTHPEQTQEFAAVWRLGWNSTALYGFVEVIDAKLRQPHVGSPSAMWRGDSVSFEFGSDARKLEGNAPLRQADVHIMIAPLGSTGKVVAGLNPAFTDGSQSYFRTGGDIDVPGSSVLTPDGYRLAFAIPWATLRFPPDEDGFVASGNVNASDVGLDDDLRELITNNPDRTVKREGSGFNADPTKWGTFVFLSRDWSLGDPIDIEAS
jgi:hypothetical protein